MFPKMTVANSWLVVWVVFASAFVCGAQGLASALFLSSIPHL